MPMQRPVKLTLRKCQRCTRKFLEEKTIKKAICKCGSVGVNYRIPKMFYLTDILYVALWVLALAGSFWLWQNYKTNLSETLFATVGACVPFITLILVVVPRFFEWERYREQHSER